MKDALTSVVHGTIIHSAMEEACDSLKQGGLRAMQGGKGSRMRVYAMP